MINERRKQMSAIFKEMALTTLADPQGTPSAEAAAAALLLSHVAWQRANGDEFAESAYSPILAEMQKARPGLWMELTTADAAELIAGLVAYKRRHHPHDMRKVVSCGMFDNKVRVEWTE